MTVFVCRTNRGRVVVTTKPERHPETLTITRIPAVARTFVGEIK